MSNKIENPAECEVRAVILFLNAQNVRPIEIYRQLIQVYGEGVMNESNVRKWYRMFNGGRINVHDEERYRRLSLITEDLKNRILPIIWIAIYLQNSTPSARHNWFFDLTL
jgi:hypothetical protein